jgi:hypothetical protein
VRTSRCTYSGTGSPCRLSLPSWLLKTKADGVASDIGAFELSDTAILFFTSPARLRLG